GGRPAGGAPSPSPGARASRSRAGSRRSSAASSSRCARTARPRGARSSLRSGRWPGQVPPPSALVHGTAEAPHQLLDQAAGLRVGHHPLLHRLRRPAQLGVVEQPLGHALELVGHVIHRRLLGHLHQDRLAGRGGDRLHLRTHHLHALAAEALALHAAVAELVTKTVERGVDGREVGRLGHRAAASVGGFLCAYIDSMLSRWSSSTTLLLTFSVGVSSPRSSEKSWASSTKYLIVSQLPRSW